LVRLDPTALDLALRDARASLAQLRASLAESNAQRTASEAQAEDARANSAVQNRGAKRGIVATEVARSARSAVAVADATLSVREVQARGLRAQIQSAQVRLEDVRRQRDEVEIHAPFAGTVLAVDVEDGLIVSSALINVAGGTTLLTLADLTTLRVIAELDEAQVGRVNVDQEVVIRVDAYPDRTFAGRVHRISPLGVEESSVVTFDVEVAVTDPNAELLRSGMSADLEIVTARREAVLLVPLVAVQSRGDQRFVRLTSGELREIETGVHDGDRLEVLSGVDEGDVLLLGAAAEREPEERSGLFGSPGRGRR
jgi:HlyD family secretion protein